MSPYRPPANSKGATEQPPHQTQQGRPVAAVEVPERPALAPNVELTGEMKESGFKERQWLIQRDGQFILLPELLYRVAEQMEDGENTHEAIAARATESTNRMISADNVRQIIQDKFIPLGLVSTADGSVVSHGSKPRLRSPLALNMSFKMFGPRIIDPITKVLQVLYAPPVLIPVLMLIAFAHGWLYLVHGVTESILEVIYAPGMMLVLLALMLAATIFHEFGHASALRYGGGKVRGMGAGFYLIYPAFYTDTTDNYRLGRWARVRTDLGGFYFYLIFALGMMTLYLYSGREFLLLIVLLINLEIIYQCLPTVRFDGYWTLADLTGIPDFFSQMGAFLRSVVPIRRWKGSKLPNLKPWVKAVFVTYIIITVPMLSLLLVLLVWGLPLIVLNIWYSLLVQAREFATAVGNSNYLVATASMLQAFILELQILGIVFLLYTLAKSLIRPIWNLSKPTPIRRIAGVLVVLGLIALLTFLWAPLWIA